MSKAEWEKARKILKVGQKWYPTKQNSWAERPGMFRKIIEIDSEDGWCKYWREDGQCRHCSMGSFIHWVEKAEAKTI